MIISFPHHKMLKKKTFSYQVSSSSQTSDSESSPNSVTFSSFHRFIHIPSLQTRLKSKSIFFNGLYSITNAVPASHPLWTVTF